MKARQLALFLALAAAACGNSKAVEELVQCGPVDASTTCPSPPVTYAQIQPILEKSCVPCHDGTMKDVATMDDIWPLTTYENVAEWESLVKDVILTCTMPPADGDVPFTNAERSAIVQWVLCKVPE